MLANSKNNDTLKLNFEGAYSKAAKTPETFYLERPVYFFKNGLVFLEGEGIGKDSLNNDLGMRKYLKNDPVWGTYEITGDTINVSIRYIYIGGFASYRQTNFQGIIKDKNTIIQWHVTKPYPKLPKYKFKDYLSFFEDTVNLYYKPLSIKSYMDSISEKIWPNKYRN